MSGEGSSGMLDAFNDTLPFITDEEDNTLNQSSDSVFRGSSASSLCIPNPRRDNPCSTPRTPQKRRAQRGRPAEPSTDTSTPYKCTICRVSLKTQKGLDNHLYHHKLEERARRIPTPEQLIEKCISDACKITQQIEEAPMSEDITGSSFSVFACSISESTIPEPSPPFQHFVKVCVEPLAHSLQFWNSVLPSTIRKGVRRAIHSSLADPNIRTACLEALLGIVSGPINIAEQYLQEFCRRLVHSIVAFIIKQMRESVDDQHVLTTQTFSKDDFYSLFSQQTLHNVAGYSVKAVLVKCRQHRKSPRWRDIKQVALDIFAHVGTMEANLGDKTFWTALLARKAYTFVSEDALQFFIEVAKVLCYTETCEGTLPKDAVLQNVSCSPFIISTWGNLIGSTLSESDYVSDAVACTVSL